MVDEGEQLAHITPKGGDEARPVRCIWEPSLVSIEVKNGMQLEVVSQAAHLATRDANGVGQGARLVYGGKPYTVSKRTDDGAGMTALILARAAAGPTP